MRAGARTPGSPRCASTRRSCARPSRPACGSRPSSTSRPARPTPRPRPARPNAAVDDGADEIDVVLPYERYAAGDRDAALEVVQATREAAAGAILKVILETGRIGGPETDPLRRGRRARPRRRLREDLDRQALSRAPRSTRPAPMLEAIQAAGHGGFKAAGGVRTAEDAGRYLALADEIMGEGWTSPQTFRFGASGLLADLLGEQAAGTLLDARSRGHPPQARRRRPDRRGDRLPRRRDHRRRALRRPGRRARDGVLPARAWTPTSGSR